MNWQLLLPLLVTTFLAMLGWVVVHRFNARRDIESKRREVRVAYLIEAYRRLEAALVRRPINVGEYGRPFESAIADIQLLGTQDQARMAVELATAISKCDENPSAGPLLLSLRDELRKELSLGALKTEPVVFRLSQEPKISSGKCDG